jgi:crossover junction endodeoxyribonuclease RusA
VAGEPKPQGSSRAFVVKGRAVITSSSKGMNAWRQRIATEAQKAMENGGYSMMGEKAAVEITAIFYLPRPKCIKNKAVPMTKRPDLDKLLRAMNDALTGIVYRDDSQITDMRISKEYAAPDDPQIGVSISIDEGESP